MSSHREYPEQVKAILITRKAIDILVRKDYELRAQQPFTEVTTYFSQQEQIRLARKSLENYLATLEANR